MPDWFEKRSATDKVLQSVIESLLDLGEASAIALSFEIKDCLLIIDDIKGRKYSIQNGLAIIGTVGILLEAKLRGVIPLVKPILLKIKETFQDFAST